jgi:hypothetical protein
MKLTSCYMVASYLLSKSDIQWISDKEIISAVYNKYEYCLSEYGFEPGESLYEYERHGKLIDVIRTLRDWRHRNILNLREENDKAWFSINSKECLETCVMYFEKENPKVKGLNIFPKECNPDYYI